MSDYDDYGALIKLLNADDGSRHVRRKHRLPAECYTLSECEYFFTLCARHQGTPFRERDLAVAVVESLLWRKQQHDWRLYTLCLMPDHLHFLMSLEPHEVNYINGGARGILPEGILNQVAGFKSFTTTQVWWRQGGKGPLWQRSSYDRVIRYNQSIQQAASYILNNPVRKGIVKQWQDYPYSSLTAGSGRPLCRLFKRLSKKEKGERHGGRSLRCSLWVGGSPAFTP